MTFGGDLDVSFAKKLNAKLDTFDHTPHASEQKTYTKRDMILLDGHVS